MTVIDDDAWTEWEDDTLVSPPPALPDSNLLEHIEETQTHSNVSGLSSCDSRKWGFDLSELEHEMSNLSPTICRPPFSDIDVSYSSENKLISIFDGVASALQTSRERVQTLQSLALVVRLHVMAARSSFIEPRNSIQTMQEQLSGIAEELKQMAGEWGDVKLLETTLRRSERQELEEMTELLHQSLTADNDDLTLFQEVVEQIFDALPDQSLVISTNWLDTTEMERNTETMSYLKQMLAISNDELGNLSRMKTLSEADILQDAKDIGRDELLINGERVRGARGYDTVVDALQRQLEIVLARQAGKTPEQTPMAVSNALQSVSMAVVHASNRTESGGNSYELLVKFLSNREMDRVLLRPDSARAAPLEVCLDLGPYLQNIPGSDEPTWAFGLRVKLLAVTCYLVCDAEDPTKELYAIETKFCNRLAFPVGLTPFHPLNSIRKDRGSVAIRLVPCTTKRSQVPVGKSK